MSMKLSEFERTFECNIERRRKFSLPGYKNLAEVCNRDFDGDYVTPLQIEARSPTGPCLVSHYWFSVEELEECRRNSEEYPFLKECGYARVLRFNKILNSVLKQIGIKRKDTYMTQVFHLLPPKGKPKPRDIRTSFEAITQHEIRDRKVIAVGKPAEKACKEFGDKNFESLVCVPSPSRSKPNRVNLLADAIESAC